MILFLDTASMSRESDDNLSSINSAYTGNYIFTFYLYFIDCIYLLILHLLLAGLLLNAFHLISSHDIINIYLIFE